MPDCDPYHYPSNCPYPNTGGDITSVAPVAPSVTAHSTNLTSFLNNLYSVQHLRMAAMIGLVIVLLTPIFLVVLDYLDFRRLQKVRMTLLELTPPSTSSKSAHATDELFNVLHEVYSTGSWKDRILRRKQIFSCEVVSSREGGILYMVRVPEDSVATFQQVVSSYLPSIQFKEAEDYISQPIFPAKCSSLLEFKLSRHFAYPLRNHDALSQHDPVAYITGALTKPKPDELLALQLVLSPTNSREANRIRNKLLLGSNPNLIELTWALPLRLLLKLMRVALAICWTLLEAIGEMLRPAARVPARRDSQQVVPITKAGQEVNDAMLAKLGQPLFRVDIRAYIVAEDSAGVNERVRGLSSSLASFRNPGYQSLMMRHAMPLNLSPKWQQYRLFKFMHRLPSLLNTSFCLLSSEEVSGLYHFPFGTVAHAENTTQSFSKTLPAPTAIKHHADQADFDVVIGMNHHHGTDTPIGLTAEERERHMYIIGGTGNGKTTMLEYAIVQDIRNGKGVAIIDPHGDSAKRLLKYIPESRLNDVIYLNPRDLEFPIGVNLLELPAELSGSDLAHEKDLVAEAVISVLRKVFDDDDTNAYRIERVLRNAIHTAFIVEGATIFTVLRLLTDKAYRNKVTKQLTDDSLKRFWKEELGKAGEFQRVKISGGPIARIERYERSEAAKRMLGQHTSTVDFDDILASGKILICNFSKGSLGEDTSTLFGATVLAKLQLAAWRRDRISEEKRKPFYLYVDEFQNFASESFMGLFSEARKYRLFVTIAQQSIAQLRDQDMLNTILDNVGTVIAFRSKSPETERILLHQFGPQVEPGEIGNLPSYTFYIKIDAVQPQEPTSGETIVLPTSEASEEVAAKAVEASRKNYATQYDNRSHKTKSVGTNLSSAVASESRNDQGMPHFDGPPTLDK